MSDTLSVSQAASYFGVTERTIWRWLQSGRLSAERSGGRNLIKVPPDVASQPGHAISETRTRYGPLDLSWLDELQPGPWPYTAENLAKRKAILLAKRRRAAERIAVRGRNTRPDPEGLTGVDYIRELRGPIGPDVEDDVEGTGL